MRAGDALVTRCPVGRCGALGAALLVAGVLGHVVHVDTGLRAEIALHVPHGLALRGVSGTVSAHQDLASPAPTAAALTPQLAGGAHDSDDSQPYAHDIRFARYDSPCRTLQPALPAEGCASSRAVVCRLPPALSLSPVPRVPPHPSAPIAALQKMFDAFDSDGSGALDRMHPATPSLPPPSPASLAAPTPRPPPPPREAPWTRRRRQTRWTSSRRGTSMQALTRCAARGLICNRQPRPLCARSPRSPRPLAAPPGLALPSLWALMSSLLPGV